MRPGQKKKDKDKDKEKRGKVGTLDLSNTKNTTEMDKGHTSRGFKDYFGKSKATNLKSPAGESGKNEKRKGKKTDRPISTSSAFVVQESYIEEFVLQAQKEAADMPVEQPTEFTLMDQTGLLLSASAKDLMLLLTAPQTLVNGKEIFTEASLSLMLLTTLPTYIDVQARVSKPTFHPLAVDTTLEFIKTWISAYPAENSDYCEEDKSLDFTPNPANPAKSMAKEAKETKDKEGDKKQKSKLTFEELDPEEMARQLTLLDFAYWKQCTAREALKWVKSKNKAADAPNIVNFIESRFNGLTSWVSQIVVMRHKLRERAKIVAKLIAVASKCHEYRNYSAVMAIMSGLQAIPVHRLTHTWSIVLSKDKTKVMFETLQGFVSREGNFPNFRAAHAKAQTPMIPYLGIVLQDMLFVDEGNKNFDNNGYINFQKRRRWFQCCQLIDKFVGTPFSFYPNEAIQEFLTNFERYDDEWLFQRSNLIEPRKCSLKDLQALSLKKILRPEAHIPQSLLPHINKKWEKEKQKLGVESSLVSGVSGTTFQSLFRSILSLEQEYLKKMEILIRIGITPLVQFKLLTEEGVAKIFSCVDTVNAMHTSLYHSLLHFYKCPHHLTPCRGKDLWDYHRFCDIGELFLQKIPQMRAVYTEFFSHYSEERLNTLLSEAIAEAMSEEEAEGERSVGADLLSYEELIKEVVPGFTYVSFMQRVMNQIGHQFTFLRKAQQMDTSHSPLLSAAITDLGKLLAQARSLSTTAIKTEFNEPIYAIQKQLGGFNGRLWHKSRNIVFQGECYLLGPGSIEPYTVVFFTDCVLVFSRGKPAHYGIFGKGQQIKQQALSTQTDTGPQTSQLSQVDVVSDVKEGEGTVEEGEEGEEGNEGEGEVERGNEDEGTVEGDDQETLEETTQGDEKSLDTSAHAPPSSQTVVQQATTPRLTQPQLASAAAATTPQHDTTEESKEYFFLGLLASRFLDLKRVPKDKALQLVSSMGGIISVTARMSIKHTFQLHYKGGKEVYVVGLDEAQTGLWLNYFKTQKGKNPGEVFAKEPCPMPMRFHHAGLSSPNTGAFFLFGGEHPNPKYSGASEPCSPSTPLSPTSSLVGIREDDEVETTNSGLEDKNVHGAPPPPPLPSSLSSSARRRTSSTSQHRVRRSSSSASKEERNLTTSTDSIESPPSIPLIPIAAIQQKSEFSDAWIFDSSSGMWRRLETYVRHAVTELPSPSSYRPFAEVLEAETGPETSTSTPSTPASTHTPVTLATTPAPTPTPVTTVTASSPHHFPSTASLKTLVTEVDRSRIRGLRRTKTTGDDVDTDSLTSSSSASSLFSKERSSPQLRRSVTPAGAVGGLNPSLSSENVASPRSLVSPATEENSLESADEEDNKHLHPSVPRIGLSQLADSGSASNSKKRLSPRTSTATKKGSSKGLASFIPASPRKARPHEVKKDHNDSVDEGCSETSEDTGDAGSVLSGSNPALTAVKEKNRRSTLSRLPLGRKPKPDSASASPPTTPSPTSASPMISLVATAAKPESPSDSASEATPETTRVYRASPRVVPAPVTSLPALAPPDNIARGLQKQNLPSLSKASMSWMMFDGLLFGGVTGSTTSNKLFILYNLEQSKTSGYLEWREITPSSPAYESKNPITSTAQPSSPPSRCLHSSVTRYDIPDRVDRDCGQFVDATSMYIFGGAKSPLPETEYFDDLWEYNIATNTWCELKPKNGIYPRARAQHVMFLADKIIYIWGGKTSDDVLLNDMWAFDLEKQVWCVVPTFGYIPQPRAESKVLRKDEHNFIIYGGRLGTKGLTNQIYIFSVKTGTWSYYSAPVPLPSCSSMSLLNARVDPENEPDGLTFSVFGGYTASKEIKKLKTPHSWNVENSFSSESEDEVETPEDADETLDTCYTPFFSVNISGDFQRSLSYFDDSECRRDLYALTCEGDEVHGRNIVVYKPSTTIEADVWKDDNRLHPFNLTYPLLGTLEFQNRPALLDSFKNTLKDIPRLVTIDDLFEQWQWHESVVHSFAPMKADAKEKDQDEEEKEEPEEKKDFIPVIETRIGANLAYSLLKLEGYQDDQKQKLAEWESHAKQIRHAYVARYFGHTYLATEAKNYLVYAPVENALTLEFILNNLVAYEEPTRVETKQTSSTPTSPSDPNKLPTSRRHSLGVTEDMQRKSSLKNLLRSRTQQQQQQQQQQPHKRRSRADDDSLETGEDGVEGHCSSEEAPIVTPPTTPGFNSLTPRSTVTIRRSSKPLLSLTHTRHLLWCICNGLLAVQQEGIVGNITPASVALSPSGRVKILPLPWLKSEDDQTTTYTPDQVEVRSVGRLLEILSNLSPQLASLPVAPPSATEESENEERTANSEGSVEGNYNVVSSNPTTKPEEDIAATQSLLNLIFGVKPPTLPQILCHPFFRGCKQTSVEELCESLSGGLYNYTLQVIQELQERSSAQEPQKQQQQPQQQQQQQPTTQQTQPQQQLQQQQQQQQLQPQQKAKQKAVMDKEMEEYLQEKNKERVAKRRSGDRHHHHQIDQAKLEKSLMDHETKYKEMMQEQLRRKEESFRQMQKQHEEKISELIQESVAEQLAVLLTPLQAENKKLSEAVEKLLSITEQQTQRISALEEELKFLRNPQSSSACATTVDSTTVVPHAKNGKEVEAQVVQVVQAEQVEQVEQVAQATEEHVVEEAVKSEGVTEEATTKCDTEEASISEIGQEVATGDTDHEAEEQAAVGEEEAPKSDNAKEDVETPDLG